MMFQSCYEGQESMCISTYMDIFLPKLLIQALCEGAQRKLSRREHRRGLVPAQRGGRAREQERAALAVLVEGLPLKRADRLARKRKGGLDVRVRRSVQFLLGDLQERLPDPETRVEERYADVGVWPARAHRTERGLHFCVVVVGYWERCCLGKKVGE
jgi:hypothetical protein